jgi:hypothetical protein
MPDAMPGTESVSGCERARATVPTEQAAEQQWDEVQIVPETDPAPLFADGQVVVVRVIECRIERSFNGSWRARLTCEVIENSQSGEAEGREYGIRLSSTSNSRHDEGRRGRSARPERDRSFTGCGPSSMAGHRRCGEIGCRSVCSVSAYFKPEQES